MASGPFLTFNPIGHWSSALDDARGAERGQPLKKITVYSRSWCPYCVRAKALLDAKGVDYVEVDLDREPERLAEMLTRSGGRRTVPQIFFDDHHVGGSDDLYALERAGALNELLEEATGEPA